MHGVFRPSGLADEHAKHRRKEWFLQQMRHYRWFMILVFLPTLLAAAYFYLVASNQYESSASFVVRRSEESSRGPMGLGQIFGVNLGASQAQSEASLVQEYLLSHDAVALLRKQDRLVERFHRPEIDFLSRLRFATPRPETLLAYYQKHVTLAADEETGVTHLTVRAFTPDDSYALTSKLLAMGEARINELNERAFRNRIADSKRELALAESALTQTQAQLTAFRRTEGDIDPAGTGKAQIGLVTDVTSSLVTARSKLESMGQFLSKSSPQYRAQVAQVGALQAQLAGQSSRLAGSGSSIASSLGGYEDLVIRKEFASQRYTVAAAGYEQARSEALKQQLYLTRIVDPNRPIKSEYPKRGRMVATVFFALLIAYAIGWLLVAGVKEHSLG